MHSKPFEVAGAALERFGVNVGRMVSGALQDSGRQCSQSDAQPPCSMRSIGKLT